MKNGVFFRLALDLPKKSLGAWKKVKLADVVADIPEGHDAHEGGVILGSEITVTDVKTLKAALEKLENMGLEIGREQIERWEKTTHDDAPAICIYTKGAVKRTASIQSLVKHLESEGSSGEEFIQVDVDAKQGRVEVFGYLGTWDSYSAHFRPLLMLGIAAGKCGGTGTLACLADVELLEEPVFVRGTFSEAGVDLIVHPEPQDLTDEEVAEIQVGLGENGEERIRTAHGEWLEKFTAQKAKRLRAGCVGWLRPDGTFGIEPRYRGAGAFSEGLALVSEKGSWDYGYIDERGELVLPYQYFAAGGFLCGRATAAHQGMVRGYIDRTGAFVVEPKYTHAEDFVEDRAVVGEWKKRGYIDLDGKEIVTPKFATAKPFAEGYALVAEHDEYTKGGFGFIDRDGKVAIPLELECAGIFHEGYAVASENGLWGFLDRAGKFLFPPRFTQLSYMVEGLAQGMVDNKWGVVDEHGNIVMPHEHAKLGRHHEWFISTGESGTTFYSMKGEELFRVPYTVIGELRDDHMTIANGYGGPFGYMHRSGRVVIEPRYELAAPFSDGLALVQEPNAKLCIIDHSGKVQKEFDLSLRNAHGVGHFAKSGVAWVQHYNRFGLVTRNGTILRPPEFQQLFGFGEELIYVQYPVD